MAFLKFLGSAAVSLCFVTVASAQVIWSDTYLGQSPGVFPSLDYPGGAAGPDYTPSASSANARFLVNDTIGNAAPSLQVLDTDTTVTTGAATLLVTMNHFAPFDVSSSSGTPILRLSYDFRIDSFSAAANNTVPRFILRADNINATGSQLVIAFGYNSLDDGDADQDLTFFAATQTGTTTNVTPSNATAIGLIPGTGWQPGFNFGTYTGADAASNDSNDEFYRISMDYNAVTGGITGSVTRLSTGESAAFPSGLSLTAGKAFSSDNTNDRFLLSNSDTATVNAYFDNFVFQAIPEPGAGTLAIVGLALGALRRRKR